MKSAIDVAGAQLVTFLVPGGVRVASTDELMLTDLEDIREV